MNSKIRFGVEIEGGWKNASKITSLIKDDGSVIIPEYSSLYSIFTGRGHLTPREKAQIIKAKPSNLCGEVASPVFNTLPQFKRWTRRVYPDATNATCGLHIHVSFPRLIDYATLMTRSFNSRFLSEINRFGENFVDKDEAMAKIYWDRFFNKNSYSLKKFCPLGTLQNDAGHKYRFINYGAFTYTDRKRTFECRSFPAFNQRGLAEKAVELFLKLCEDYIAEFANPEDPEIVLNMQVLKRYLSPDESLNKE